MNTSFQDACQFCGAELKPDDRAFFLEGFEIAARNVKPNAPVVCFTCAADEHFATDEIMERNERLRKAAPDLLAAATRALARMEWADNLHSPDAAEVREQLRAAIAKAEGSGTDETR